MPHLVDSVRVATLAGIMPMMAAVALFGIGVFVLSRNHKAAVNRLFAAGTLALAGGDAFWFGYAQSSAASSLLMFQRLILAANIIMLSAWYFFSLTFGRSDRRQRPQRQRWLVWTLGAVSLALLCLVLPGTMIAGALIHYDGSVSFSLGWGGKALVALSLALSMVILRNVEMTFRHANRETRQRIKFLVVGLFGILGFHVFWLSRTLLHAAVFADAFGAQAVVHLAAGALMFFSLVRHRLLDVDVFVSRYMVYRSLTLLLVGGYLVLLGVGQEAVRILGFEFGEWSSAALLIIGGLALGALLLADGFQRRVKIFIDTHFYRNKYDYRKEWLSLTERLARAVTIDEGAPRIVQGLLETMWVGKAGIYLVDASRTRLQLAFGINFGPEEQVLRTDSAFIHHAMEHSEPINVERARSTPLGRVGADLLEELWTKGIRIAAPMVVRDEVVGLLVVGPELSGQPFRPDDYDLCRTVAAQAATVILNARLAEDLAQGREIRAFAEMASFIIHDIKNCANMLSLVASNAEANIHNPAFQQDAIRTIRQSVEKMQGLLRRLSAVRQPNPSAAPVDLNGLVQDTVHGLTGAVPKAVRIVTSLGLTTPLFGDAEQLESVIRNLTMNAVEALEGAGEVRIQTFRDGEEAVLVVSDNGRGMSAEFMSDSLFRPFRSTKGGLGIGLYQCKQIAEAHGGHMEVTSAERCGTTSILRLPIDTQMQRREIGERQASPTQATMG